MTAMNYFDSNRKNTVIFNHSRTRNKIHLHARQLLKRKTIAQLWTTNGKILMKDKDNRIYETNTMDALAEVVQLLDPTYELIQK
jgi:hypothetical protein